MNAGLNSTVSIDHAEGSVHYCWLIGCSLFLEVQLNIRIEYFCLRSFSGEIVSKEIICLAFPGYKWKNIKASCH